MHFMPLPEWSGRRRVSLGFDEILHGPVAVNEMKLFKASLPALRDMHQTGSAPVKLRLLGCFSLAKEDAASGCWPASGCKAENPRQRGRDREKMEGFDACCMMD
jgi:hypothetical protein